MPDEAILRAKAREAIQSGRLPMTRPRRMFAGPSAGATCAVCGESVPQSEMEFEIEFRAGPAPEGKSLRDTLERLNANPEVRCYHLHHHCFVAWELERSKAGSPERRLSI